MSPQPSVRTCQAALVGAAVGALTLRAALALPEGHRARWERTNHVGEPVSLLEGPAYVAGATAAAALAGSGPALAGLAAGGLGALDDLAGDSRSKGLRGHLRALSRGEVTTGAVKIAGLALTGLVAARSIDRREAAHRGALGSSVDSALGGAVIAGAANLVNLLDLRPGRALKATLIAATVLNLRRGSPAAASAAGAAAGVIGRDLAGRTMLGDTGANSAGALLGAAFVERHGRRGRLAAVAVITGLTVASEKVSFTTVIESTPGLRELDALGRATPPSGRPIP